jgi:hypothetical protein
MRLSAKALIRAYIHMEDEVLIFILLGWLLLLLLHALLLDNEPNLHFLFTDYIGRSTYIQVPVRVWPAHAMNMEKILAYEWETSFHRSQEVHAAYVDLLSLHLS